MTRLSAPMFSPEHGAYVVLGSSFLLGAVFAGSWNFGTTVAFVTAFAGFQAQFPFMLMLRKGAFVGRYALWGAVYAVLAVVSALRVLDHAPAAVRIVWVAVGAFLVVLALNTFGRYKSLVQELIVFCGLSLAAAWSETATQGFMPRHAVALWLALTLGFWGAVFAVHVRSRGIETRKWTVGYGTFAFAVAVAGAWWGIIPPMFLWLLVPSGLRLAVVVIRTAWWRELPIRHVGFVETGVAAATVLLGLVVR